MAADIDWEAEGFLEGLDDEAVTQRIELLEWLHSERDFTLEQLREGHAEGLLTFLPAERVVMGGPPTLSANDIAERADIDLALMAALRHAQGLPVPNPDALYFTEEEAALAGTPGMFRSLGMSDDQILGVARVLGRGLAHAAEVMRATALEIALDPGATERALAERYATTVEQIMPFVAPMVERTLRMHLRNMVRTEALDATERSSGRLPGAREVGVAFADLVGFTPLGEELPAEEVGHVAGRLAVITAEVVTAPVRMVKSIGDAAMLVSDDRPALVDASIAVVDAVNSEGPTFPQVRVGLASGQALSRGGDWFGRPVNLASRVTSVARAGSVLATEDVHDAAQDAYRWSFAGERRLKGVAEPVKLFRARPLEPDAQGS